MKIFLKCFAVIAIAAALGACSTTAVTQTPIKDCPAKSCFTQMVGGSTVGNGFTTLVGGITITGKDGSQNFRPLYDGVVPDRANTLLPALGSSLIMGTFQYQAASRHARAIESTTKNSGPSQVFIMAPEGGSAQAINTTEVGVVTQQELTNDLQPVHFCKTCNSGD